jgi:hypothetical protein
MLTVRALTSTVFMKMTKSMMTLLRQQSFSASTVSSNKVGIGSHRHG